MSACLVSLTGDASSCSAALLSNKTTTFTDRDRATQTENALYDQCTTVNYNLVRFLRFDVEGSSVRLFSPLPVPSPPPPTCAPSFL